MLFPRHVNRLGAGHAKCRRSVGLLFASLHALIGAACTSYTPEQICDEEESACYLADDEEDCPTP
jgi:hypothetical protein